MCFRFYWYCYLLVPSPRECALELVQFVVRSFADDFTVKLAQQLVILFQSVSLQKTLSAFQVGLPANVNKL